MPHQIGVAPRDIVQLPTRQPTGGLAGLVEVAMELVDVHSGEGRGARGEGGRETHGRCGVRIVIGFSTAPPKFAKRNAIRSFNTNVSSSVTPRP